MGWVDGMGGLDGVGCRGGYDEVGLGRWLPLRKTTLPDPELLTSRRLLDHKLRFPFNLISIIESKF